MKRAGAASGAFLLPSMVISGPPLPRFTALDAKKGTPPNHRVFFRMGQTRGSALCVRAGSLVYRDKFTFMSQLSISAGRLPPGSLSSGGEVIRLVQTLRGGDRPKNAEAEFPDVCSMPRGCFEPWGLFRKPLPARMTVAECLREFQTGGLRRLRDGNPFKDVIPDERTPHRERKDCRSPKSGSLSPS